MSVIYKVFICLR